MPKEWLMYQLTERLAVVKAKYRDAVSSDAKETVKAQYRSKFLKELNYLKLCLKLLSSINLKQVPLEEESIDFIDKVNRG